MHGLSAEPNYVSLDSEGATYWNGKNTSPETIAKYLRSSFKLLPQPPIQLDAEMGASCEKLEAVRSLIEREYKCGSDGHCDERSRVIGNAVPSHGPPS